MVHLVIFINLFFVPVLPLYMIYRKNQKPLNVNLDLLFRYCIITACNIPLAKIPIFLAKKGKDIFISIDSGYYTLATLASGILIYLLYEYQKSQLKRKHCTILCGACNQLIAVYKKCWTVLRWLFKSLISGCNKLWTVLCLLCNKLILGCNKMWNVLCKLCEKLFLWCSQHYIYYKSYLTKRFWTEKIKQRGIKQILGELAPAYCLIFSSCFMMLIFEPILLYATNMDDFWFDFSIMIWPVLGVFACFLLGGIALVSAIYFVNLFFSGRAILYKLLTLVGFIVFFLLYLQGNWMAGNLPPLTGIEIIWDNYGDFENFVLKSVLILLSITAIIFVWRFKLDHAVSYAAVGAGVISVMLIASLIPTVVANDALKSKDTFVPTLENYNTISSNRNFLIFLVDAVDSKVFYDVMTNDKDFDGVLDDFTYYPDTLSVYPFTRDSIPAILTGSINYNEINFLDYCSNAYNRSPLFEKLKKNEYNINLYSSAISWAGQRNFEIENSTSIYDIKIDFYHFLDEELKYIQFKYLPYIFKQHSKIETLDFNTCKKLNSEQNEYYFWGNWNNYAQIQDNYLLDKRDKNYFQFIHCEGGHVPHNMDKNLSAIEDTTAINGIENGTYNQKVAASLTMIKAYLQRLKDNNAYDNSVIVIMADHGYQHHSYIIENDEEYFERLNPILFIKGIDEQHELIESNRPVSYMDLPNAFCDLIDGKQSTELFSNLEAGQVRKVLWHIWTEEHHMVEYETTGKAWEVEKFTPTGNVYDLKE